MSNRNPWQDRWVEPTLAQLLDPLKAQQRRLLEIVMEQLDAYPRVEKTIIWYGPAWKWTIQYKFTDPAGRNVDTLCYLVPNPMAPLISVPLSEAQIDGLPMKRLSKYVRDGIRSAKCAVAIHWANWTPTNQSEIGLLMDLIKRKYQSAQVVPNAKSA